MSWLSYDGSLPSENISLRKDDQRRKTHHKPQRKMIQPSGCNKFPNGLEGEILSQEPPSSDGGSRNKMTKGALAPNEYPSPGRKLNREKSPPLAWDRIPNISFGKYREPTCSLSSRFRGPAHASPKGESMKPFQQGSGSPWSHS